MRNVATRLSRRGHLRRMAAALSIVLCSVPVVLSDVSAASATSTIQRGLSFYRGKTLTFVTGSVGGGTDLTARALAPLVSQYLHATMNVENEGQANGVPGQDALAAANSDGLTVGYVNLGSIASEELTDTPGFNFNPGRLSWIAGQIGSPAVLVASPRTPFTSFASIKNSATPVQVAAEVPSTGTTQLEVLTGLLGIHIQLVTGYSTTSAVEQGFARGDTPAANLSYANAESLMASGMATPVATSVMPPPGTPDRQYALKAYTYTQLIKTYGPKHPSAAQQKAIKDLETYATVGFPIVTQARVADYKLEALRAAVKWALAQPSYRTASLAAGINPSYLAPVSAKAAFNQMMANGKDMAKYITRV